MSATLEAPPVSPARAFLFRYIADLEAEVERLTAENEALNAATTIIDSKEN